MQMCALFFYLRYVELCITLKLDEELQMDKKKELINAVLDRVQESDGKKKLMCAEAFELAQQLDVEIPEIGRICNQHNIKIYKCQLGCFA